MKITIVLDTDKETVEDLKRLQKGIDELIGKKLGVTSQEQPKVEEPKPQLQTIEPEKEEPVSSTGFPTQPETQQFSASSPHEIMEKVQGWPNQPKEEPKQEPQKTEAGATPNPYEDMSAKLSEIFSNSKTRR